MGFMEIKPNQLKSHHFVTTKEFFRSKSDLMCCRIFIIFTCVCTCGNTVRRIATHTNFINIINSLKL